jgi:GNAT superfamily N-acetyltransferase
VTHDANLSGITLSEAAGDVVLRDGTRVHIRPIRPEDDHALVDFFDHLSPQSVYQRFFTQLLELSEGMAFQLSHVNYTNRMALVAETTTDPPEIMGIGRYAPVDDTPPEERIVELGLTVLDRWQGRGLGRVLMRETLRVAVRNGFVRYRADILADNRKILHLLATEARVVEAKSSGGVTSLLLEAHIDHL